MVATAESGDSLFAALRTAAPPPRAPPRAGRPPASRQLAVATAGAPEQRGPAAFISETELRFMTPDFHDAGDAQVHVSLNGQQFAEDPELTFTFVAPACAIA